jgi:hypothetical protein
MLTNGLFRRGKITKKMSDKCGDYILLIHTPSINRDLNYHRIDWLIDRSITTQIWFD